MKKASKRPKLPFGLKLTGAFFVIVFVCAAIHIISTIVDYDTIFMYTAVPLRMIVALECAFWGVLLLIALVIHWIVIKHSKK